MRTPRGAAADVSAGGRRDGGRDRGSSQRDGGDRGSSQRDGGDRGSSQRDGGDRGSSQRDGGDRQRDGRRGNRDRGRRDPAVRDWRLVRSDSAPVSTHVGGPAGAVGAPVGAGAQVGAVSAPAPAGAPTGLAPANPGPGAPAVVTVSLASLLTNARAAELAAAPLPFDGRQVGVAVGADQLTPRVPAPVAGRGPVLATAAARLLASFLSAVHDYLTAGNVFWITITDAMVGRDGEVFDWGRRACRGPIAAWETAESAARWPALASAVGADTRSPSAIVIAVEIEFTDLLAGPVRFAQVYTREHK